VPAARKECEDRAEVNAAFIPTFPSQLDEMEIVDWKPNLIAVNGGQQWRE
jgi:hypothetical protein